MEIGSTIKKTGCFTAADLCCTSVGLGSASAVCTSNEQTHVAASIDSNTYQHAAQFRLRGNPCRRQSASVWW